jgi:hypothetical protein
MNDGWSEKDVRYLEADEVTRGYMDAEREGTQPELPEPELARVELVEGEATVVKEPEAVTFALEHNAPAPGLADVVVEQEVAQAGTPPKEAHLEDQERDESAAERVQDEVVTEDEMLDGAPLAALFDTLPGRT